jgi:hypothetical protein
MTTRILVVLGLLAACGAPTEVTPVEAVATETAAPFVDAAQRIYDVRWDVTTVDGTQHVPGAAALSGGLALSGSLALVGVGRDGDAAVVEARWLDVERASITMLDREVAIDRDELLAGRAWLVVPPGGDVERVVFERDASPLFRQTMSGLVGHIDLRASLGVDRASRVVPAGHGLAEADYAADAVVKGRFTRALRRYVRFDAFGATTAPTPSGDTVLELDADGLPIAIEGHESVHDETALRRADDRFFMRAKVGERIIDARMPDASAVIEHDPTAAPDAAAIGREIALRAAEGITPDDIAIVVEGFDNGLRPRNTTISRATGLLRADPNTARELAPMFLAARTSSGRAYVLDMLSSAGTPEAQTVMRELLGDPAVQEDPDYDQYMQRFAFLHDPDPRSAELLLGAFDDAVTEGDTALVAAIAYPVGSMSRQLRRDPMLAEMLHARLVDTLAASTTAEVRTATIAGLGNVGRANDLAIVQPYLADADSSVRASSVAALRYIDTAAAREVVAKMLADEERVVATRALGVLEYYADADAAVELLATAAEQQAHHPEIGDALARALTTARGRS